MTLHCMTNEKSPMNDAWNRVTLYLCVSVVLSSTALLVNEEGKEDIEMKERRTDIQDQPILS